MRIFRVVNQKKFEKSLFSSRKRLTHLLRKSFLLIIMVRNCLARVAYSRLPMTQNDDQFYFEKILNALDIIKINTYSYKSGLIRYYFVLNVKIFNEKISDVFVFTFGHNSFYQNKLWCVSAKRIKFLRHSYCLIVPRVDKT